MNKQISLFRVILALLPLVLALPFAMDIYVPAIPTITQYFAITTAQVQLTLNLFMIISGLGQLLFGPLADRFGRQIIVLFAIVMFLIGSISCIYADTIILLIVGRILQAVGSCGMMVLGFAIARDLYNGVRLAKVYSYLNGAIAISPMFGPFIGSYLDVLYGWQATFEALLVVCGLAMICYFSFLAETLPREKCVQITRYIGVDYWRIMKNPSFFIYTLATAFGMSYLFIFCAISPVLIITLLHVPELSYGYYFCFMGVSLFCGSLISAFIVEHLGIYKTVLLGYGISLLGGVIMFVWHYVMGLTLYGFITPMLLVGIGGTFGLAAGNAGSMIPFGKHAGMAAALGGGARFFYAGVLGLLLSSHITSTLPLAIPAIVQSCLGLILMLVCRHVLAPSESKGFT